MTFIGLLVLTMLLMTAMNDAANTVITIEDGHSQAIECTEAGKVVTIASAKYLTADNADWGDATACNTDFVITVPTRNLCQDKASCTIKANDEGDSTKLGQPCSTKRSLVVEYQCAEPGTILGKPNKHRAMVFELLA